MKCADPDKNFHSLLEYCDYLFEEKGGEFFDLEVYKNLEGKILAMASFYLKETEKMTLLWRRFLLCNNKIFDLI
jgi:hypothetical protein